MKVKEISESNLESKCKNLIESKGGLLIKLFPFTIGGLPDRIVILPQRPVFFVELKKKGKEASKLQLAVHRRLLKLGQAVYVCDDLEQFKLILLKHLNLPAYDFGATD